MYDYRSNGFYFVTIVTRLRQDLLENRKDVVEKILKETIHSVRGTSIDTFIIMPNHIHTILVLRDSLLHLGEIVRRFKAKTSRVIGQHLWQANYYEHVIRDENALERIRQYIALNPEMELIKFDQFYHGRR